MRNKKAPNVYLGTSVEDDLFEAVVAYCESHNTNRSEVLRGALQKWARDEPTVHWPKKGGGQ